MNLAFYNYHYELRVPEAFEKIRGYNKLNNTQSSFAMLHLYHFE